MTRLPVVPTLGSSRVVISTLALILCGSMAAAQEAAPGPWLRLDPLPAEMKLTPRESFDGVPPRFVLMTDGAVYVGGRRELLRGVLDKADMQALSTRLDFAMKSVAKAGVPKTITLGEGPALFRFSTLAGAPVQIVIMGSFPPPGAPALEPLPEFIRRLANFRHASLRPFDPQQFAMTVKERSIPGGCRTARGLPPLGQALSSEIVVAESVTRSFPTGAEMAQVCDGSKRYTIVFRPLVLGER